MATAPIDRDQIWAAVGVDFPAWFKRENLDDTDWILLEIMVRWKQKDPDGYWRMNRAMAALGG